MQTTTPKPGEMNNEQRFASVGLQLVATWVIIHPDSRCLPKTGSNGNTQPCCTGCVECIRISTACRGQKILPQKHQQVCYFVDPNVTASSKLFLIFPNSIQQKGLETARLFTIIERRTLGLTLDHANYRYNLQVT